MRELGRGSGLLIKIDLMSIIAANVHFTYDAR